MTPSAASEDGSNDTAGLDEKFYSLSFEELAFFLKETGIDSELVLESHLMDVQAKAYKVSLDAICIHFMLYRSSLGSSVSLHTSLHLHEVGDA